jgi:ribonuclease HII
MDEVGRGSLAGPVVAAAVIFRPTHAPIVGVNDSKRLTPKKRKELAGRIKAFADSWAVGTVPAVTIDRVGIGAATAGAMGMAAAKLGGFDDCLIDGRDQKAYSNRIKPRYRAVIRGDMMVYSIAAASIIAKVHRDELMMRLDQWVPHYGWRQNKGYGTKQHIRSLFRFGASVFHRKTFIDHLLT